MDAKSIHTDEQFGAMFLEQARYVRLYVEALTKDAKLSRTEALAFARDMQVERFRSLFNSVRKASEG